VAPSKAEDRFAALAAALVADPAARVDLAEAANLVAADFRPGLDVARELARLDALAEAARGPVLSAWSDAARVAALNRFLFVEQGFHGNTERYEDPRNSLLPDVLDQRTGLPITLSLVYLAIGRRLGLPVEGIGFPGHFLVRWRGREDFVIDAFHGEVLSDRALTARLREALGRDVVFSRSELAPITPRAFLVRLLSNLKRHAAQAGDFAGALTCCERLLQLQPDDPEELRDRGLVYERLECFAAARDDLERFLALAPGHPTAATVRAKLAELEGRRTVVN
jgi:regulator of sirC expression with transglutaminase-like and TPR domain